jgi:2-polyprenyl-3-methyl-5-hydroxy-6-metoxy-1,4-benzoquinol methylase
MTTRATHEREHARHLVDLGPEKAWGWSTPAGQLRAERRAVLIARGAQLGPGKRVLEIGCGTGLFTGHFAASGASIVAVDVAEELIAIARARHSARAAEFRCAEFETMSSGERFDAVIGSSVLHHLEIDVAMSKMAALLKPGGRISFAEPNMLNPQVFMERHVRGWFDYVSPDETAFVRWSFSRQWREAGYTHVRIRPFDWLHPATPRPLIRAVQTAGAMIEHVPLLREFAGSLLITGVAR